MGVGARAWGRVGSALITRVGKQTTLIAEMYEAKLDPVVDEFIIN